MIFLKLNIKWGLRLKTKIQIFIYYKQFKGLVHPPKWKLPHDSRPSYSIYDFQSYI